jgi:hypothetical protein
MNETSRGGKSQLPARFALKRVHLQLLNSRQIWQSIALKPQKTPLHWASKQRKVPI